MQTGLPVTSGGRPLYKTQWSVRTRQFLFEHNPSFTFISGEAGKVYVLGWGKHYQKYTFYLEKYIFLSNTLPQPNQQTNAKEAGIKRSISSMTMMQYQTSHFQDNAAHLSLAPSDCPWYFSKMADIRRNKQLACHVSQLRQFGLVARCLVGKQKGLGLNLLWFSFLFKSCGLWTLSCDFVPYNYETLKWLSSLPTLMQKR